MVNEKITVNKFIKDMGFSIVLGKEYINNILPSMHVLIPGLEFSGYLDYFDKDSVIIIGDNENNFLTTLSPKDALKALSFIISKSTPLVVFSSKKKMCNAISEVCKNSKTVLCKSSLDSSDCLLSCYDYLNVFYSTKKIVHGTLVSIHGNGILLKGASGIGKSEIALELVKRGHKLVSDDAVVTFNKYGNIFGKALEHQKSLIEVRGLGIIDIQKLYGLSAILDESKIDYVINLTDVDEVNKQDRILEKVHFEKINGVNIQSLKLPVGGGRSVADVIEVTVLELSCRRNGNSANNDFLERYDKLAKGEK